MTAFQYRREIDGLRALAVIPVILFHADFEAFKGGFVGVDVFFVISGYLITSIIIKEMEAGTFTLAKFYERRARRILPALLLVMLACLPFAWMWMMPSQLKDFGQSLIATSFFASNFLFWQESGYFSAAADEKPLLHTWSLANEEQYYLLFPLFMLVFWRMGWRFTFASLVFAVLISLGLAEWASNALPSASFYLLLTRAWELLAGGLVAIALWRFGEQKSNLIAVIGLALVVASIFILDESDPFPGIYAVPVVLGTALFIAFGSGGTLTARLLGMRLLVGIGLISYSAYLWHLPLISFIKIYKFEEIPTHVAVAIVPSVFAIAFVSWKYVESPFRAQQRVPRKVFFPAIALMSFIACASGLLFHLSGGGSGRFSAEVNLFLTQNEPPSRRKGLTCFLSEREKVEQIKLRCPEIGRSEYVIWGDSHAQSLAYGLEGVYGEQLNERGMSACPPILDFLPKKIRRPNCPAFNARVLEELSVAKNINTVILAANWSLYWDQKKSLLYNLRRTIRGIKDMGYEVFLVGSLPQWSRALPQLVAAAALRNDLKLKMRGGSYFLLKDLDEYLSGVAEEESVGFIDILGNVCNREGECDVFADNKMLRVMAFDEAHLTLEGSSKITPFIVKRIERTSIGLLP